MSAAGDAYSPTMIEFINIPKDAGDVVVLLLLHPGQNVLARYLPSQKINDLMLALQPTEPTHDEDVYMAELDGSDGVVQIMDLNSFLTFAIDATACLEGLHKSGIFHREGQHHTSPFQSSTDLRLVRANAFHLNAHTGRVKIVHHGNRAQSLENLGSPSSFLFRAFSEADKLKVKEALCYL